MKSTESNVESSSEFFNYVPSVQGKSAFFYPVSTGHFLYRSGYSLKRTSYDSFLIMYVQSGEVTVETSGFSITAKAKDFVLLNCHEYHGYSTKTGYDCLWLHFDGIAAAAYYRLITAKSGNVFSIQGPKVLSDKLWEIFNMFRNAGPISEPYLSKLITDLLTGFLVSEDKTSKRIRPEVSMENIISFINENFKDDITNEQLASLANVSPYHFIRIFKQSTGYTPHEYLINTRIENAKYLLSTTSMSAKDICFCTGFSGESVFCSSFRKNTGMTPSDYRLRSFASSASTLSLFSNKTHPPA